MPIKVFVVDDHQIIRRALHDIITSSGMEYVGDASKVDEGFEKIKEVMPDVAIVDLNLGEGSGMALLEKLQDLSPAVNAIVYSMRSNIQTIAAAYRSGAKSYVTKGDDPFEIIPAIEYAAKGKLYFVGNMGEQLAEFHAVGNSEDPIKMLTDREYEIFIEAAVGRDIEYISKKYNVSHGSVSNRLVSIRKKLNVNNQGEFAMLAIRYGHITQNEI